MWMLQIKSEGTIGAAVGQKRNASLYICGGGDILPEHLPQHSNCVL